MKKSITILVSFLLLVTSAVAQMNSGVKTYTSLSEMKNVNLNIGTSIVLDTAGIGGRFTAEDSTGRIIDNGITFQTANPAVVLVRDVSQSSQINVRWFGVTGDSTTDDGVKIQIASDVTSSLKKILYFPSGNYKITLPIILRKDARWQGDGYKSFLFNSRTTSTITGDTYVYFMGNFIVPTYDSTLGYNSSDTLRTGSNIVKLSSAQTDSFSIGGLCFIESPTGYHGAGGYLRPYYAEINKVIDIDRTNGYLYLKYPMDTTLPVAIIRNPTKLIGTLKSDVLGNPYYVADNCGIEDMRMYSSDYVAKRYGAFECDITHNYIHGTKGVGGNGLSHCNFTDNTFEFSYKLVEYAFFSSDTRIERNTFLYFHGSDDGDIVRPGIKMGENVRNCNFNFNTVVFGDNYITGPIVSFDHAFNNQIIGNKIYGQKIQQNAFDVRASDDSVRIVNNYIANNEIWADSVNSFINLSRGSTNAIVSNNRFINNTFHGKPKSHAYWLGGDRNTVVDNYVDDGDVTMDATTTNCLVSSQSIIGNIPSLIIPYKSYITPKIKGNLENGDGTHLAYTDTFGIRHIIPYPDTVVVMGDAAYSLFNTDRIINLTTALTASRAVNLFNANLVPAGTRIIIQDFTGSTNSTNFLNIVHAGTNTINGGSNVKIQVPYGQVILFSDGVSQWNYNAAGVSSGGTVTNVSGTTNQVNVATGSTIPVISLYSSGTLPGAWNLGTPASVTLTNGTALPESGVTSLTSDLALKAPLASPAFTTAATIDGVAIPTISSTNTLTNKAITKRITSVASSATPSPSASTDDGYKLTALAASATFASPGTGTGMQELWIRIKDNGTSQSLSWNAIYRASTDLPLPTLTTINKTMYLKFMYNSDDSKWDLISFLNNF